MTDVLIVEDSEFQQQMLIQSLPDSHTVVATAETGVEALHLAERHQPDIILMDIIMPGRDGIKATQKIRENGNTVPIIMCTSVDQKEKMKRAIVAGADEYITKPYRSEELQSTLLTVTDN